MTRRDMIIIAILVNTGLLAILFMMAINSDSDKFSDNVPVTVAMQQPAADPLLTQPEIAEPVFTPPPAQPESSDTAARDFSNTQPPLPVIEEIVPIADSDEPNEGEVTPVEAPKPEPQPEKPIPAKDTDKKMVEVTVKRGDSLDKIAKANGTTIKEIKEANNLTHSRLDIGQVLKVPVGTKKSADNF